MTPTGGRRPVGRSPIGRGVFAIEDQELPLPDPIALDTSFVVEALIATQPRGEHQIAPHNLHLGRSPILLGSPSQLCDRRHSPLFRATRVLVSYKFTPNLMNFLGPSRV